MSPVSCGWRLVHNINEPNEAMICCLIKGGLKANLDQIPTQVSALLILLLFMNKIWKRCSASACASQRALLPLLPPSEMFLLLIAFLLCFFFCFATVDITPITYKYTVHYKQAAVHASRMKNASCAWVDVPIDSWKFKTATNKDKTSLE